MSIERPWMQPFSIGNDTNIILPSRGLKLIGVRFYPYDGNNRDAERKAHCIQKSLYGSSQWFYFNKGFRIKENNDGITEIEVNEDAFDSNYLLYSDTEHDGINIGISAIVGANGTGKSTLIDTIVRLTNNMSAAIIGEDYVYTSALHLHYIDNVYASLAVYINNHIKILTCKGRRLELVTYETDLTNLNQERAEQEYPITECYVPHETISILNGNEPEQEILQPKQNLKHLFTDWFYTLVSNYSLYAYNYRDYINERTNAERLEKLKLEHDTNCNEEDEFWLKGVFHKNDGYQTPVVIHPMRDGGYINAQKENYLGKQNLISLCFERRDKQNEDGTINHEFFPFRIINQTHHIVAFYFYDIIQNKYHTFYDFCLEKKYPNNDDDNERIFVLERAVSSFWENTISVQYAEEDVAWEYLLYKTMKVIWTYKHYEDLWTYAFSKNFDEGVFKKRLVELLMDGSHRTAKIRRVVAYLRFCKDEDYYIKQGAVVDVDAIYKWMVSKIGSQLYPANDYHEINKDDLLPPPSYIVTLQLVDNEHLQEYKEKGIRCMDIIPFEGLSSGERQIAYTLGNLIYHLRNIESNSKDINSNINHVSTHKYGYVNVMLDEVELYFHPDLQRRFISLLLDSIKGLQLPSNCGINITLITHSPFVLSDIPDNNILCMSRKEHVDAFDKTFAANIHDLFNNTFILPYTIGEYAQLKITEIVSTYHRVRYIVKNDSNWKFCDKRQEWQKQLEWSRLKYVSEIIGDNYLSEETKDMLDEIEEWYSENQNLYETN
jgi:AAA15 family ATPase/GTPase